MTVARVAVEVARWLAGVWLLWSVRRPGRSSASTDGVTVVVPARNEARTLPTLLSSLPPVDVVVVDDASEDGTAEVAAGHGARVIEAPPLPDGWTGKAWACWTGAQASRGSTLVFLDADTWFVDGGLERVLGAQWERGGLLSVQPYHHTDRAYESLSAFFNVVGLMGVDACTPVGARLAPSGAFGPCLVTSRAEYLDVGGHEAVRGDVLDDVALARRYRAAELPVTCFGGKGAVSFRMYPEGVGQLLEGWTKNFAGGAASTRVLTLVLIVAWLSGCISAVWTPLLYPAYALQLAWMLRRIGRFRWWAWAAYPVGLGFFLCVFVRSLYLTHVRRRVRWKGRSLRL